MVAMRYLRPAASFFDDALLDQRSRRKARLLPTSAALSWSDLHLDVRAPAVVARSRPRASCLWRR